MRILLLIGLLALSACNPSIYTRDGVTDGDTFYLAPHAWLDDDPALQSWVAYSLVKSTCQLQGGGENPARNSDYGCELTAREHLVDTWETQLEEHAFASDPYLDALLQVRVPVSSTSTRRTTSAKTTGTFRPKSASQTSDTGRPETLHGTSRRRA